MRLSRRFEETMHDQFGDGQVPGPLHLSIGQEAVAVGACSVLRKTDAVLSTHRGHHHCLAKGASPDRMMAELLGRADGYSRGRGGSMHVAIPEIGLLGTNGIVGAGIPIAAGAAYGMQAQGRDDVTVCFFGEGATGTGVFGEALNIAALWSLPEGLRWVIAHHHGFSKNGHVSPMSALVCLASWIASQVDAGVIIGDDTQQALAAARHFGWDDDMSGLVTLGHKVVQQISGSEG